MILNRVLLPVPLPPTNAVRNPETSTEPSATPSTLSKETEKRVARPEPSNAFRHSRSILTRRTVLTAHIPEAKRDPRFPGPMARPRERCPADIVSIKGDLEGA